MPRFQRLLLPASLKTSLAFYDADDFTVGPGLTTSYDYSGNGMYDPYQGVGGQQPTGFDQLMNIYGKYEVIASKCTYHVYVTNLPAAGRVDGARITLYPDVDISAAPSIWAPLNKGITKWLIGDYGDTHSVKKWKLYRSTRRALKRRVTGASELQGTDSANPTRQWYWRMYFYNLDTVANLSLRYSLKIKYYVRFTERKELDRS